MRATIAWIREESAATAKRQDRFGIARLMRIDVTHIAGPRCIGQRMLGLVEFTER